MSDTLQFDPALKELLIRKTGDPLSRFTTEEVAADEVPVVARLVDPSLPVKHLTVVSAFGWVVTGRVPLDRIVTVRQDPNVASLKASKTYRPTLAYSVPEIEASAEILNREGLGDITGRGVIIGIVDWGCDFAHKNVRDRQGATRLLYLWDQRGGYGQASPKPFGYGREFTREEISEALRHGDPYGSLGYDPADSDPTGSGTHGTHVMDIAAGNGSAPNASPGVAPEADIIFVHLKGEDTDPEDTLGDSARILEAVRYIVDRAGDRPVAINCSLGRTGGPHDQTPLVVQGIDALLDEKPGRVVVMSAGNYFESDMHSSGRVGQGQTADLGWHVVPRNDETTEMEVWYTGSDRFLVELVDPGGRSLARVPLGEDLISKEGDRIVATLYHRRHDPNSGDNQVNIFLWPDAAVGTWTVRLHGEQVTDGAYHAWIERDAPEFQSRFTPDCTDPFTSTGSICNGYRSIAVAAYSARYNSRPVVPFSSAGPTRDGRLKPDISAPGAGIRAARSSQSRMGYRIMDGLTIKSGTSMAAPHVTGTVALMFQAAGERRLSAEQVRQILINTVRRSPPYDEADRLRYGAGRVDAAAAVKAVLSMRSSEATIEERDSLTSLQISLEDLYGAETTDDGRWTADGGPATRGSPQASGSTDPLLAEADSALSAWAFGENYQEDYGEGALAVALEMVEPIGVAVATPDTQYPEPDTHHGGNGTMSSTLYRPLLRLPGGAAEGYSLTAEVESEGPVAPNGQINVTFSDPIDPRSAQGGLRISPDTPGDVYVNKEGTVATWIPAAPLAEGNYTLLVEGVTGSDGQPVTPREIPLYVEALAPRRGFSVPEGHTLAHSVTATMRQLGRRFDVAKVMNSSTGRGARLAFTERGERVDFDAVLQDEKRAQDRRYGKIHPILYEEMRRRSSGASREAAGESTGTRSSTGRIPIAIWLVTGEEEVDKSRYLRDEQRPLLVASREGEDEPADTGESPEASIQAPSGGPQDRERPSTLSGSAPPPPSRPPGRPDPLPPPPEPLVAYRRNVSEAQTQVAHAIHARVGLRTRGLSAVPALFTQATPAQIEAIARMERVTQIFLYEPEGVLDLSNQMSVSNANTVVNTMGWKGTNIRVAVWEGGPDSTANLTIEDRYTSTPTDTSDHARLVTGIIRNKQSSGPKGFAPEAKIYSANNFSLDALVWAVVNRQCCVINQSFHRHSEAHSGIMNLDDMVKDYLASHYPFPTIVQAAGNFWSGDPDGVTPPSSEYVNHKGYNSIAVGNHNDAASAMSGDSVFRNPTSTHSDRELPEISANGDDVTAVGTTMGGTSFASPATAGTVALLQNANNALLSWPEGNRAILFASAGRNIRDRTWWEDVGAKADARDGAGALDAEEAIRIATNRQTRNNTATMRGWNAETLHPSDFDANGRATFRYNVLVPATGPKRRVKVAIAWSSKTATTPAGSTDPLNATSSTLTVDYDLYIYDGTTRVAKSASFDNSYEIAEFTGQPGKTYSIMIHKFSGNDWAYCGVAWTVHQ